ncbi:MAG: hypothetical protein DHS20C18_03400 [Saprospiraceae bacterium]|nr:MAG: hypothetical protein DHS20C18_03400 [Saprospiraceae bacterium]
MKKLSYTILIAIAFVSALSAQPKWEWGLFVGGANYLGDLVETEWPVLKETMPAAGFSLAFTPNQQFFFQTSIFYARVKGDDQNLDDAFIANYRNFKFESELIDLSFQTRFELFGKKRFRYETPFNGVITPYLFGGVGLVWIKAKPDFSLADRETYFLLIQEDKAAALDQPRLTIPVGAGVKLDLGKKTALMLDVGFRTSFTDLLDGISFTANPDKNDWYLFGGLTFVKRIGYKDTDNDGIVDKEDACPRLAGVGSARGCPDADGDGVEDLEDLCPDRAGIFELNGCPDSDGDMVMDMVDECPDLAGREKTNGCPDADNDGIRDAHDECPWEVGNVLLAGCPDCDGDGIANKSDLCPTIPGNPLFGGCPFPDKDRDGIADEEDLCPTIPGEVNMRGCPDQDKDGVADKDDLCPNIKGEKDNSGCPRLTKEEEEILQLAQKEIQFETGSAILKSESLKTLYQIVQILKDYPHYHLSIRGHTDDRGKASSNQELSEKRAKACFEFLTKEGIQLERMTYEGLGESEPIGNNKTSDGRKLNRRVEFTLSLG